MGQIASSESGVANSAAFIDVELPKDEVIDLFQKKCRSLLRSVEIKAITSKTNVTNLDEKNILVPSDLAYLLQIVKKDEDISNLNGHYSNVIQLIYESFKIIGSNPFLYDFEDHLGNSLTINDLIVSSIFHSGRYKKILPDYDYYKMLFISLSSKSLGEYVKFHAKKEFDTITLKALKPINEDEKLGKRLLWKCLPNIKNFDYIDVDDLYITAYDLHQLLTLFLLLSSIPKSTKLKMEQTLYKLLHESWSDFEESSLCLLKFMDININVNNLKTTNIKYSQLFNNETNLIVQTIKEGFTRLFKNGFLSSNYESSNSTEAGGKKEFAGSKLINNATIASLSAALKAIGSETQITTENLIKLYIGKEAGFSIRSLELKIFKWQAPTILIVSGKRLKSKKATTNKRYLQFDSEYPRYFRSSENPLKSWQTDNDRITYAVLVSQPWRTSNKKNFGTVQTMIFSLSPHFDYFKSSSNPILNGELIYFNTLGLGLGFGNDQPINKNGIKKYLPGDISLTIESNLEFAIFRHITDGKLNSYFSKSNQFQLKDENYEDRFMITDLEVWGVGSTKELELQKKQWEWEQKQAEARQSVNVKNLAEDRALLEMVGLVGNHGGSGGSV